MPIIMNCTQKFLCFLLYFVKNRHIFLYQHIGEFGMKNYYLRTLNLAHYILDNKSTIRKTAKQFNMAKSTVHHDLIKRLPYIDMDLFLKVKKLLNLNFDQKHLRGGEATKQRYLKQKKAN